MEKKHRKRVPLACLNCKKRKVRCDKKKPCTGCIKNNVGHLCVYIEPEWVELLAKISQAANATESQEYRLLQEQYEQLQRDHHNEVDRLKRELAGVARHTSQGNLLHVRSNSNVSEANLLYGHASVVDTLPVTILRKLRATQDVSDPIVSDDHNFSMRNFRRLPKDANLAETLYMVSLYLWLNIIKLDPQLTALWYKITNLQKLYHIYKTRLLDQYSGQNAGMRPLGSVLGPGVGSGPDSPACGHHKCPVVACEFNLIVEESNRSETPAVQSGLEPPSAQVSRGGSVPPVGSGCPHFKKEESERGLLKVTSDAARLLMRIQGLWAEIRNNGRGNAKLSYQQLAFLLDFYLRDTPATQNVSQITHEVESQHLFRFFRPELMKLFVEEANDVRLNVASFSSELSDAEVYGQLKLQGIFLLMLALIVEESLDVLRLRRGLTPEVMAHFHSVFPLEAVHQGMGYKHTNVTGLVREFVELLSEGAQGAGSVYSLMLTMCLLMGLLNRLVGVFKKEGVAHDVVSAFTSVFTLTLDAFDQKGHRLEIWTDPAQVVLQGADVSPDRQTELRLLLCQVWVDFMRIINLVVFSMIPIVKHLQHLDRLIESFQVEVTEAEPAHAHISYLKKLGESSDEGTRSQSHIADLITSLHVNYLVARSSMLIRNGICGNSSRSRVCIADFHKCMAEIAAWSSEITLTKLRMTRYFEVRTTFNYLEFLFTFITFLQCEENGDKDQVTKLIPALFAKCLDLNKFLQGSVVQFGKGADFQYVIVAIAENLSRVSHLIAGLLIRFVAETSGNSPSGVPFCSTLVYSQTPEGIPPITIDVSTKDEVIREVDRTIQLLENSLTQGSVHRATKIWRFYMTFIRNSHKMNPAAYAKLHAEAFGSGRILDACPVLPTLSGSSFSANSMGSAKISGCPVAHTPVSSDVRLKPSRCPVDHLSMGVPAPAAALEPRKRQCPFDHEALRNSTLGFHESNIRGQTEESRPSPQFRPSPLIGQSSQHRGSQASFVSMSGDPLDLQGLLKGTPPQQATVVAMPQSMFNAQLVATAPPLSTDMMDWDTLPNFNFDLVGDEGLMVQINGGDFNNPSIEGMFQ